VAKAIPGKPYPITSQNSRCRCCVARQQRPRRSGVESCNSRHLKSVHLLIFCTSILNDSRCSTPSAAVYRRPGSTHDDALEWLSVPHARWCCRNRPVFPELGMGL
jgi:hypothetical protein